LDDILRGASSTTTTSSSATAKAAKTEDATPDAKQPSQPATQPVESEGPPTPYLTPNETKIVDSVFNLLLLLLRDGEEDNDTTTAARSMEKDSRLKRRGRAKTIMAHDALPRYIVDCALYTLPPPGVDYVSAVPPPKLQQLALVAMAVLGSLGDTIVPAEAGEDAKGDREDKDGAAALRRTEAEEEAKIQSQLLFDTMPIYLYGRVTAIDRLMFLCCTGAYAPKPFNEEEEEEEDRAEVVASLLSTHSIATFRSCLPAETANRMVLHALAPPPPDDADEMGRPAEPSIVMRLVTTLADNLRFLQSHGGSTEGAISSEGTADIYRATIGATGAAGALGVFLTRGEGDATREMLLRMAVPPPPMPPPPMGEDGTPDTTAVVPAEEPTSATNLIDFILQHVATYDPDASPVNERVQSSEAYVIVTLLRLLSEWVLGMPRAVTELLSSPSSVSVGVFLRSSKRRGADGSRLVSTAAEAVPALSGFLLGLCLEYVSDSDGANATSSSSGEAENVVMDGPTIMNMIQSMGVGKYLNMIDEYKKRSLPLPYCGGTERSSMERRAFAAWYGRNVTFVRRRVVMALAGSGGDDEDTDAEDNSGGNASVRSLRRMVSTQAQENEELQAKLEEALSTIASQSAQLKELKRVAELGTSAETNDMISEFTEKVAELEKVKADLKKEAEHQSKLKEEAIKAKENEMEGVREELRAAQTHVEEMRRDNVTLSEEMSGLSAAYNALEQRYHQNNNNNNAGAGGNSNTSSTSGEMTAGGETAAEDGGSSVPGGEAAAEDPGRDNYEVSSLRDENARLREDVRAANEWMSMAVSKMEEMGEENESLARSLEEARTAAASSESNNADSSATIQNMQNELSALRQDANNARKEVEAMRLSSQEEMKAKDDELARQQALVQQLEARIEETKLTPTANEDSSSQTEELESLRKANADAQEWMASAVTHVDVLTKQVQEKDEQLEKMSKDLKAATEAAGSATANETEAKVTEMEKNLLEVSSERDELKSTLATINEEMGVLKEANASLSKASNESQSKSSSEKEALHIELDKVKAENVTLTSNLNEFQSWSEAAQGRMAEVEAQLEEATKERDELKTTLAKNASEGAKSMPHDEDRIASLEKQVQEKTDQLERMQDQLIEDAEERDADNEKLLADLQEKTEIVEAMKQKEGQSSAMIDKLTLEKEKLLHEVSKKQTEIDSVNAGKNDAETRVKEANQRISELELAKATAEAQVDKLMALEHEGKENLEDVVAITVERDELKSELDDITEEYEETRNSLERTTMENGNLVATTRALEQDNKSLEYQYTELESKMKVMEDERSTLQSALEVMKIENEDTLQLLKERTHSLEGDIQSLEEQLEQREKEATETVAQWEARCSALQGSGEGVIRQWDERVQSLEGDVKSLENQLELQEKEAAEAIAQWEARCASFEKDGGDVIKQWEERVQSLEGDVSSLEEQLAQKESEATEAIAQWEARCASLEENGGDAIRQWEERVQSLEANVTTLEEQLEQNEKEATGAISQWETTCSELQKSLSATNAEIESISKQNQSLESNLATSTSQVDKLNEKIELLNEEKTERIKMLANLEKDLLEMENKSEQVVKQWQERLEKELDQQEKEAAEVVSLWEARCNTLSEERVQLDANIAELEGTIQEHENSANEAIAQWEARCNTLNEKIESLELQLVENDKDTALAEFRAKITSLSTKLEVSKSDVEKTHERLKESKVLLAERVNEWKVKEASFASTIQKLEGRCSEQQKTHDEDKLTLHGLKDKCTLLEDELTSLQQERNAAIKESEESQVVVLNLKEELRFAKEELQSFATDQFTVKATEMATQALRQQMVEIRSQYAVDQEVLTSEREARNAAEEEVSRLKSDLALLAQATEYNEDVDVHVRKIAKRVSAENIKAERKEMEELRSTIEHLREELGSCRWKNQESQEKAANARLQMSILEQEVSAAKVDLQLIEDAMEELENSKIEMSVSLEYRVEALENERLLAEQSYEEEINGIKAELAQLNQEKDNLAHKLEQSEKANAALVYSTSHESLGGEESESEVIKLQLERAQLLAKINELGADLERRVREAVSAQASSSEAELIVEKQSRKSIESSLSDALSELEEVKAQLAEQTSKTRRGELAERDQVVQNLQDSIDDMNVEIDDLTNKNKHLQASLDASDKENKSTINDLTVKLQKAEEHLRSKERESRFEAAIASEIANLRANTQTSSNGNQKQAQALVLRGIDQNMRPSALFDESKEIDRNSAYIIEMYDYVVELKNSITEERQMYKDLLAEHEDLLALLGQAGLDGMQFNACE